MNISTYICSCMLCFKNCIRLLCTWSPYSFLSLILEPLLTSSLISTSFMFSFSSELFNSEGNEERILSGGWASFGICRIEINTFFFWNSIIYFRIETKLARTKTDFILVVIQTYFDIKYTYFFVHKYYKV